MDYREFTETDTRPVLVDLFCGVGGCSVGYDRAGFRVIGVDSVPQPGYPYEFHLGDAMDYLTPAWLDAVGAVAVAASPPCPRYSTATKASGRPEDHPDLVPPVIAALKEWGGLWCVENVPGAPMENPLVLCGSEFGLGATCNDGVWRQLRRHRHFDSNVAMMRPAGCAHRGSPVGVYGGGGGERKGRYQSVLSEAASALGIDWATSKRQLTNAIPPAYTEWIGGYLIEAAARVAL